MEEPEGREPPGSFGIEAATHKIIDVIDHTFLHLRRDLAAAVQLLGTITADTNRIERRLNHMPAQQDLDDATQSVIDGINKLGEDMVAAFGRLEQKIASGVDATQDVANLKAEAQKLADLDAQAASELAPAPAPTPPGGKKK